MKRLQNPGKLKDFCAMFRDQFGLELEPVPGEKAFTYGGATLWYTETTSRKLETPASPEYQVKIKRIRDKPNPERYPWILWIVWDELGQQPLYYFLLETKHVLAEPNQDLRVKHDGQGHILSGKEGSFMRWVYDHKISTDDLCEFFKKQLPDTRTAHRRSPKGRGR